MCRLRVILLLIGLLSLHLFSPSLSWGSNVFMPLHGRAVSLKILYKNLEKCQPKNSCDEKVNKLSGINKILGYIIDKKNEDIILIGRVDNSLPSIYLDDFIIALRNTWMKYIVLKDKISEYSYPGCSIDPSPQIMQRLQGLGDQILRSSDQSTMERGLEEWHKICRAPQRVRVLGIPFDSHFAYVLVKADYDMKSLVDGSDMLPIQGLKSLPTMMLEKIKNAKSQDRSSTISLASMNRFWFYPGDNSYIEDDDVVIIERSPVKLLTEEEFLDTSGEMTGSGAPNLLAAQFAGSFTTLYTRVAAERPIFTELENLFRVVALARILKFKHHTHQYERIFDFFLNDFAVSSQEVSRDLPGRSNVVREKVSHGAHTALFWLPSCGGVDIRLEISEKNFTTDKDGNLSKLKAIVLKTRPARDSLAWDYVDVSSILPGLSHLFYWGTLHK